MRRILYLLCATCLAGFLACQSDKPAATPSYVTTHDGKFYRGDKEYKFIGANFWFGAVLASEGQGGDRERLQKELDLMHGLKWYDYGARMYDPILLTWNAIDPMCEDYYPISPYAYCANNPVNRVDPDGRDDYYNKEGVYLGTNKAETDYIYIIDEGQYWKLGNGKYVIKTASRIALNDAELDADAYSKIFTNCFKLGGGNCSELVDGKIQVTIWQREGGSKVSYSHTEKASYEGNATASTK